MLETASGDSWDITVKEYWLANKRIQLAFGYTGLFDPSYPYIYMPISDYDTHFSLFNEEVAQSFQRVNSD